MRRSADRRYANAVLARSRFQVISESYKTRTALSLCPSISHSALQSPAELFNDAPPLSAPFSTVPCTTTRPSSLSAVAIARRTKSKTSRSPPRLTRRTACGSRHCFTPTSKSPAHSQNAVSTPFSRRSPPSGRQFSPIMRRGSVSNSHLFEKIEWKAVRIASQVTW